jgi:hypothetical protein
MITDLGLFSIVLSTDMSMPMTDIASKLDSPKRGKGDIQLWLCDGFHFVYLVQRYLFR